MAGCGILLHVYKLNDQHILSHVWNWYNKPVENSDILHVKCFFCSLLLLCAAGSKDSTVLLASTLLPVTMVVIVVIVIIVYMSCKTGMAESMHSILIRYTSKQ